MIGLDSKFKVDAKIMSRGITNEGQRIFGQLIRRARCSNEVRSQVVQWLAVSGSEESVTDRVSQEQFVMWLSAVSGIDVSESAIGRLERGEGRTGPPIGVLIALCRELKVLQLPDGSRCDLNKAADILCGKVPLAEDWLMG